MREPAQLHHDLLLLARIGEGGLEGHWQAGAGGQLKEAFVLRAVESLVLHLHQDDACCARKMHWVFGKRIPS